MRTRGARRRAARIVLVNSQAEHLFGYAPDELTGVRVEDVLLSAAGGGAVVPRADCAGASST